VEADWLEAAQEIDRMYHGAKLTAAAFAEPERIWTEHEQVRTAILGGAARTPAMTRNEWLARVAAIDRKMRQAGLVPPHSGVMN
jgi:hypothetical protein